MSFPIGTSGLGSVGGPSGLAGTVNYSASARALFARLNPEPPAQWKRLYDDLITGMIDDGTWPLIDFLQIYKTYAELPSLENIRQNSWNVTRHGSPVWSEQGFQGDGVAGHLRHGGYYPTGPGSVATQNGSGYLCGINTQQQSSAVWTEYGNSKVSLGLWGSTGNIGVRLHVASSVSEPLASSIGMTGILRVASNQHRILRDGVFYATDSSTSTAPSTDEVYSLARNVAGVLTTPSPRQMSWEAAVGLMTDEQAAMVNGRINAFFDKVPKGKLVTLDKKLVTLLGTYVTYEAP